MPITQQDLQFKMQVTPDLDAMQLAVKNLGASINKEAKNAKAGWDALSQQGAQQLESIRAHSDFTAKLSAFTAAIPELDAMGIAIEKLGKTINEEAKAVKSGWELLNEAGKAQQESFRAHEDFTAKLSAFSKESEAKPEAKGGGFADLLGGLGKQLAGGGGLNIKQLIGSVAGGELGGGIGGALGAGAGGAAAALGPIGIAIAATAAVVKGGLQAVAGGLQQLQGDLGPVGLFLANIPLVGGEIASITSSLVSMAGKANPAVFRQWQMAIDDVQGVIGQSFLPVLDLMRQGVRFFGDVLATILPTTQEMGQILVPLQAAFDELKGALKELFTDPAIKQFITTQIQAFIIYVSVAVQQITLLTKAFQFMIDPVGQLLRLIGVVPATGGELRSSVGAASQQAQFSGIEEYSRQLQIQAFSQGISPEQQTANTAGDILQLLRDNLPNRRDVDNVGNIAENNSWGLWLTEILNPGGGRIPGAV